MRPTFRSPASARNPLSLVGAAIATAMAALFLALFLLQIFGYLVNPYIGIVVFVAVPAVFLFGLILIPVGAWRAARRPAGEPEWPVFDLRQPHQRHVAAAVVALTLVNLLIVSMAAYGGVHYMESTGFCGQVCHTTMEPQFVAHRSGPHARVACVSCHVGGGAEAFMQAKLTGVRQLVHVTSGNVPRPVPPPPELLQPARNTCEQCHWPEKFHGDRVRILREYADDEANSESATTLRVRVGGGSAALGVGTGIHWHMNLDNEIEYIATGPAGETIPYVRLRRRDGTVREFTVDGTTPEQLAAGTRRRM
ncbi:MAG: cytochrome C, partial [Acidimicrobiia bacterium]|nr:cytochrome C [Acidimicrobiia bacterium]